MPSYNYRCPTCRRRVRMERASAEESLLTTLCVCGEAMIRLFPTPGISTPTFRRISESDGFEQAGHAARRYAKAKARAAGIDTTGKRFFPSLCRDNTPFDPLAWCGDWDDMKNRARDLGMGVNGHGREVKATNEIPADPEPFIAPDILEKEVKSIEIEHGRLPAKERADVKEKTRKRFLGNYAT